MLAAGSFSTYLLNPFLRLVNSCINTLLVLLLYPLASVQMWDQADKGKVPFFNGNEIELGTPNPAATAEGSRNGDDIVKEAYEPPPPAYNSSML